MAEQHRGTPVPEWLLLRSPSFFFCGVLRWLASNKFRCRHLQVQLIIVSDRFNQSHLWVNVPFNYLRPLHLKLQKFPLLQWSKFYTSWKSPCETPNAVYFEFCESFCCFQCNYTLSEACGGEHYFQPFLILLEMTWNNRSAGISGHILLFSQLN